MTPRQWSPTLPASLAALAAATAGCSDGGGGDGGEAAAANYALASVVIDADGNRTTYVQTVESLDDGPFTNKSAIELPGNGVVLVHGTSIYAGLTEEPTWVRYSPGDDGVIQETGRLSLLNTGASYVDYGNVIVDGDTAVSVLSNPPLAVVWSPAAMEILGEVDLSFLARDGYELEVWTTSAHDGLVYIPGRWADWEGGHIFAGVSTTILDPKKLQVVGTATDDRCASGGRVVFDADGYAYVMGDGRNYSIQMFANAAGEAAPTNCLLRIAPGATTFEQDYFHEIPSLTGGLESISELETARQGSGLAFAKMFYPAELPDGVEPVDFSFWSYPAHRMWRIHLADPPSAEVVEGVPFSTIGFGGSVVGDHLFSGESPDGATSEVYETDPDANQASLRFTMDGYFYGLHELTR